MYAKRQMHGIRLLPAMALRLFLAVFLMVFALVAGQSTTPTEKAFVRYKVVPDVLPVAPKEQAYVRYDSGAQARLGNVIQVSDVSGHVGSVTREHRMSSLKWRP